MINKKKECDGCGAGRVPIQALSTYTVITLVLMSCQITVIQKQKIDMKKRKQKIVLNQLTYQPNPKNSETPQGVSVTIPDEAFTIRELYARSQQGILDASIVKNAVWATDEAGHEDLDLEKFGRLDLSDKEKIKQANAQLLQDVQEKLNVKQDDEKKQKVEPPAQVGSESEAKTPDKGQEVKTE